MKFMYVASKDKTAFEGGGSGFCHKYLIEYSFHYKKNTKNE